MPATTSISVGFKTKDTDEVIQMNLDFNSLSFMCDRDDAHARRVWEWLKNEMADDDWVCGVPTDSVDAMAWALILIARELKSEWANAAQNSPPAQPVEEEGDPLPPN